MRQTKPEEQMETLSRLIDAMHKEKETGEADNDTAQLLRLAKQVKIAAGNERPPAALVAATVAELADNPARVPAKRRWLQAAMAGVAAAAFLIATQLNPQGVELNQGKQLAEVKPFAPVEEKKPAAFTPPMTVSPLPPQVQPMPEGSTPAEITKPAPKTPADSQQAARADILSPQSAAAPSVLAEKPDTPVKTEPKAKEQEKQWSALTLPGRKADRIVTEGGVIRQIFGAGQDDEIIITQKETAPAAVAMRKAVRAETAAEQPEAAQAAPAAEESKNGVNKVTVTVKGRQVTVEGRKAPEELQKIAGELAEEEQP